jgi:hypothetical protein
LSGKMCFAVGASVSRPVLLYRRLRRRPSWTGNPECQFFFLAEGRCEGRISVLFRGANPPHRRSDGTFLPDFQGVIETDDGRRSSSTTEATAGPTPSVGGR